MKTDKISFRDTNSFSKVFLDYIENDENLKPFYSERPDKEGFLKTLKSRKFEDSKRKILKEALDNQYGSLAVSDTIKQNLVLLEDSKTFTLTTGHQLNIFTGPLYFIYKIATVVNAAKALRNAYPEYNFVPVYWMATEDHDFDEISYFHLGDKKYRWETDQAGAVGRFQTNGLSKLVDEIPEELPFFPKAYKENDKLADACRCYVSEIFADEGVVVVDGDDHALKSLFAPIIKEEILDPKAAGLVEKTNQELSAIGYNSQAFIRDINFFHLGESYRERIIANEDETFGLSDSEKSFSLEEITAEIDSKPEQFSPNVILRPLYQEVILPNIGYTGGPAEVAYWLQLKSVFDYYKVDFPVLLPRSFGLYIPRNTARKIEKNSFELRELFHSEQDLKKKVLDRIGEDYSLATKAEQFHDLWEEIRNLAGGIDPTLFPHAEAEKVRIEKRIDHLEGKMRKAVERKNSDAMNQIEDIKQVISPNGNLQERHDNFLTYYFSNKNFVNEVLEAFDPFDLRFHIMWEE